MPPATLAQIEAALLARLRTRLASAMAGAEFKRVERWPGTWSQETEIDQAAVGVMPAAFLAYDVSTVDGTNGELAETLLDDGETVLRHGFVVLTLTADAKPNVATSVQGTAADPGILRCDQGVMAALVGLRIAGAYREEGVRLVGARPWKTQRGKFIAHLTRLTVRTLLDTDATASIGDLTPVPFERMDGTNGPVPGAIDLDAAHIDLTAPP